MYTGIALSMDKGGRVCYMKCLLLELYHQRVNITLGSGDICGVRKQLPHEFQQKLLAAFIFLSCLGHIGSKKVIDCSNVLRSQGELNDVDVHAMTRSKVYTL